MVRLKAQGAKAGQRLLISRRSVLTVEPRLVPIFWVTRKFSIRKKAVSPSLNRDAAKLKTRPVGTFILPVQVKKFSEQKQTWLLSQVHLAEDLEIANV